MEIQPLVFKVRRLLQQQLEAGQHYLLAVSGGADSMALAHAAAYLQQQKYCSFSVCHVEHGLRGAEALADADLVEDFCREYGLDFSCVHVDVAALVAKAGLSTEEAARRLRYEVLWRELEACHGAALLTAHHGDDQAETVLLRLLRGTGLQGLGAMAPVQGKLWRPFLSLWRRELEQYCELNGIRYCVDSSNADQHYTRNRVRLSLLPQLEQDFNPELRHALVRMAQQLREDEECLQQLANEQYARLWSWQTSYSELDSQRVQSAQTCDEQKVQGMEFVNACNSQEEQRMQSIEACTKQEAQRMQEAAPCSKQGVLSVTPWRRLPAALRKRLLRQAYFELGGKELSYERTQALEALCMRGRGGSRLQLPGKITALYSKQKLFLIK